MTPRQIEKTLVKSGVSIDGLKFNRNEIEIILGYNERNGFGSCDDEAISKRHEEIAKAMPNYSGGYYTGYGSLILQENYTPMFGDWNETSSEHHY